MNESCNDLARDELVWWLHPVPVFVLLNGLTAVAAFMAAPGTYLELWGTPKYVDGSTMLLTAGILVAFSAGVWLAMAKHSGESSGSEWGGRVSFPQTLLLFNVSFWVCIIAYGIWIALGISRGLGLSVLKAIFIGGDVSIYTLRVSLETIPGITTWTQVGIAVVVLGCLIGAGGGWKIVRGKLAILAMLAIVRALLYSERLAFLELAIPFLVLWLAEPGHWKSSRTLRTLISIAPILGGVIVYLVFTGFESFRSWAIFYSARQSSLALFGLWRLVGYYVTSLNNTVFLVAKFQRPLGAPYFSGEFLWQFPVLNGLVRGLFDWVRLDYKGYMSLLAIGANPEFNNPGGLLSPVVDFGVFGGLAYWAVMGFVSGYLYSLYIHKHPLGMCFYPIIFLTLTEVPRYIYWSEGRAFPALAYLALSATLLLRSARFGPDQREVTRPGIGNGIETAVPRWE